MESDFRNEKAQAIPARGLGGAIAGCGPSNQMVAEKQYYEDRCAQEPLRARVERRLLEMTVDAENVMRLKSILEQHPEFETFLEFQNLLNRTRLR